MNFIEPINFKLNFGEILVADNLIYHQTIRKKIVKIEFQLTICVNQKFFYGKDIKSKYRKSDLVKTKKLLSIGKDFIYHYPHDDKKYKVTYGLRSPAHKKEIKFHG